MTITVWPFVQSCRGSVLAPGNGKYCIMTTPEMPRVGIRKNVLLMPPQLRELDRAHFDGITPGRPDAIEIKPCLG